LWLKSPSPLIQLPWAAAVHPHPVKGALLPPLGLVLDNLLGEGELYKEEGHPLAAEEHHPLAAEEERHLSLGVVQSRRFRVVGQQVQ